MTDKIARNEPCHCGSGKKYKKCCLSKDLAASREAKAEPELQQAPEEDKLVQTEFSLGFDPPTEAPPKPKKKREKEEEADRLWDRFQAMNNPTPDELEQLLTELIALPEEEMQWNEIFGTCCDWKSCDIERVFRQIANNVPHNKSTQMSFFYWRAAELFTSRKQEYGHLIKEVAEHFTKQDENSYDYDSFSYVWQHFLEADYVNEALLLTEDYLPTVNKDSELLDWVAPDYGKTIYELRIGSAIRDHSKKPHLTTNQIATTLASGIEDQIKEEFVQSAAQTITNKEPIPQWKPSSFDLVTENGSASRLYNLLIQVAQENWNKYQYPPEKAIPSLFLILEKSYQALEKRKQKKKKKNPNYNLLERLSPAVIDHFITSTCGDMFGLNEPKARMLLGAHSILNQTARDYELTPQDKSEKTEEEISRLQHLLAPK